MYEALDKEVCHYARLSRLIMDGGSAELRSFVTHGFLLDCDAVVVILVVARVFWDAGPNKYIHVK